MKNFDLGGKWKVEGGNNLSTSRLPPPAKRSAFTLIEMIGVMAVMGVLAAIVVPPLIQRLEDTQRIDEEAALDEIARALVKGIQAKGRFPDPNADPLSANGWVAMGSPHSVLGTNSFYYVFPGNQRSIRKFYLDGSAAANLSMPSAGWRATLFPSATLMYIVSSSKPDLFTSSAENGPGCQTGGNSYQTNLLRDLKEWRKTYNATGKIDAPSSVAAGWTDRGEYLHVKIVDLKEILTSVNLEDWHTPVGFANPQSTMPNNWTPATNLIVNLGYSVTWTNANNNITFIIQTQGEKAPFGSFVSPPNYDEFNIGFSAVNPGGNQTNTWNLRLVARESAGYSLTPASGSNNAVTIYDNPNSQNSQRKESTNFFALRGSSLILYPEADRTNGWSTYILTKPEHRFIFKLGSWGSAD